MAVNAAYTGPTKWDARYGPGEVSSAGFGKFPAGRKRRRAALAKKRKQSKTNRAKSYANQAKVTLDGYRQIIGNQLLRSIPLPVAWHFSTGCVGADFLERTPGHRILCEGELQAQELAPGGWSDGALLTEKEEKILAGWHRRIQECSQTVRISECTTHGKDHPSHVTSFCCQTPLCPRRQRRLAQQWVAKGRNIIDAVRETPTEKGYSWKMVTIGLKVEPDLKADVSNHLKLRRDFSLLVARKYGGLGGIGSVEMAGSTEMGVHVHLHFLLYCQHLPREQLQTWLRGRDCTIPKCDHPADTRGTDSECDGSWYLDVRRLRCWRKNKTGRCKCNSARQCESYGISEAIKYAAKPVSSSKEGKPKKGVEPTSGELSYGELVIRFYLAMYKRHRIETYGLCKPGAIEIAIDDIMDSPAGHCRECHGNLSVVWVGWCVNPRDGYVWAQRDGPNYPEVLERVSSYEYKYREDRADMIGRAQTKRDSEMIRADGLDALRSALRSKTRDVTL